MNDKDFLEKNLLELVLKGMFKILNFDDINFKLTEFGKEEAATLIEHDPEMKVFWNELINKKEVKK